MKYLISVDKNGQQDISDGAPFDGYYGYDYDERTVDGIIVSCSKKKAQRMASEFRKEWKEQGYDVHYSVSKFDPANDILI